MRMLTLPQTNTFPGSCLFSRSHPKISKTLKHRVRPSRNPLRSSSFDRVPVNKQNNNFRQNFTFNLKIWFFLILFLSARDRLMMLYVIAEGTGKQKDWITYILRKIKNKPIKKIIFLNIKIRFWWKLTSEFKYNNSMYKYDVNVLFAGFFFFLNFLKCQPPSHIRCNPIKGGKICSR